MSKNTTYQIGKIEREFNSSSCKWNFKVQFNVGGHTDGQADIFYIHSFTGEGTFETNTIDVENHKRIRKEPFYHLSKEIRNDIYELLKNDIEEIDQIERATEKPRIDFLDFELFREKDETWYDLTYSFNQSKIKRSAEVIIIPSRNDKAGSIKTTTTHFFADEGVHFSAWKDYVDEQIKNESPLRLALLDI